LDAECNTSDGVKDPEDVDVTLWNQEKKKANSNAITIQNRYGLFMLLER